MALTTVSSDRLSTNVKTSNLGTELKKKVGQNKNIIINGDMQIAQRGTSSTTAGIKTVDRFRGDWSGVDNAPTQAQVDVAAGTTPYTEGFRKAFKITNGNQTSGAGSGDFIGIDTNLEAQDIANSGWNYVSSSSNITLSFWIKSSIAQNFYGYLFTSDGTSQNYPFETGSLTADTWTKITKTIPGNSNLTFNNDVGAGLQIQFWAFLGTTYTDSGVSLNQWAAFASGTRTPDNTSTWYTTNNATLEITGVQLEVGSTATDFEHRSFADELRRCQRYYYVLGSGSDLADETIGNGRGWSSSQMELTVEFPEVMRTTPSLLFSTGTNYYQWRNSGNERFTDTLLFASVTPRHGILYKNSMSGLNTGDAYRVQLGNSSAYVHFNAEL
jgi:hypothetical protein